MAMTIQHPLALGKLKTTSAILYRIDGAQRIKLKTIQLKNTSDTQTLYPTIQLYSRGNLITLTPNVNMTFLLPGYTLEVLPLLGKEIILDPGTIIFGFSNTNDEVEYLVDGEEESTNE